MVLQNTIVINTKRIATDAARRRWLHAHCDLFEPLLPPSSSVLANLKKAVEESIDQGNYVPLKEIVEQPKLIVGGRLKDYQVSKHAKSRNCVSCFCSCMACLFSHTCITMVSRFQLYLDT
jgi:hypothetical protein